MPARPKEYNVPLSLQFIADWEQRVSRQMLLIARLKMKGRPTKDAETSLTRYQAALLQLRNHAQVMKEMMNSNPREEKVILERADSNHHGFARLSTNEH
jgi:hypothetical protein